MLVGRAGLLDDDHRETIEANPAPRRAIVVPLILIALVIVAAAERDIHRRDDSEVRGNKTIWRLLSLNAAGALGYFRWGRAGVCRHSAPADRWLV